MGDKKSVRVDRILDKLAAVREKGLSCFGSDHHEFQLNAPLEESAIVEFESKHGIQLPPDYRAFLKYAGNGGAGPYYGIYPLNKWAQLAQCWLDNLPQGFLALHCLLYPDLERRDGWKRSSAARALIRVLFPLDPKAAPISCNWSSRVRTRAVLFMRMRTAASLYGPKHRFLGMVRTLAE